MCGVLAQVGLGVSAFSHGGSISICISSDEMVVDDPHLLRKCIIEEYKSLCLSCKDFVPLDI